MWPFYWSKKKEDVDSVIALPSSGDTRNEDTFYMVKHMKEVVESVRDTIEEIQEFTEALVGDINKMKEDIVSLNKTIADTFAERAALKKEIADLRVSLASKEDFTKDLLLKFVDRNLAIPAPVLHEKEERGSYTSNRLEEYKRRKANGSLSPSRLP